MKQVVIITATCSLALLASFFLRELVPPARLLKPRVEDGKFLRTSNSDPHGYRAQFLKNVASSLPTTEIAIEIGVWHGDHAQLIKSILKPEKMYLVDPWTIGDDIDGKKKYTNGLHSAYSTNSMLDQVKQRFVDDTRSGRVVLMRNFSNEVVSEFGQESIDFAYIDACHLYECVRRDLKDFAAKIKPGGFLCGHDYGNDGIWSDGVSKAVDEFVESCMDFDLHSTSLQFDFCLQKKSSETLSKQDPGCSGSQERNSKEHHAGAPHGIPPSERTSPRYSYKTRAQILGNVATSLQTTGVAVEVGVHNGKHVHETKTILKPKKLLLIDPRRVSTKSLKSGHSDDKMLERLKEQLATDISAGAVTFIDFGDDATELSNATVDFVYIDACHRYECVIRTLRDYSLKMKDGGFVCGHDYGSGEPWEVSASKAVHEFLDNSIVFEFHSKSEATDFCLRKRTPKKSKLSKSSSP